MIDSSLWLERQNWLKHCLIITSRTKWKPCRFTMKSNYRGHRLLVNVVKRNTKIDGMGPLKSAVNYLCFMNKDTQFKY